MTYIVQRALMPFAFIGIIIVAFLLSLPELRTPVGLALLAAVALLLVLRPIEREIRSNLQYRKRVLLIGHRPIDRSALRIWSSVQSMNSKRSSPLSSPISSFLRSPTAGGRCRSAICSSFSRMESSWRISLKRTSASPASFRSKS